ncbi:hypothetical protein [Flavobacterium oreochromis]|uniref:hypothetical protein n=1 Tax=Flavobacterium oreochromis TaxID=2906078 RepID=UPI00385F1FE6
MDETNPTTKPLKKNNYQKIDDYIRAANTALTNASDLEIAPLLSKRGYTTIIIDQKIAELNTVKELVLLQVKEYGDQYQATEDYNKAVALLHPEYINNLLIARIVFKDNVAAKAALSLNGSRKRSASSYCRQAELFYKGALDNQDYKTALAQRGVTEEDLQKGKTGYTNLIDLAAKQTKETGEAQQATANRDIAIDNFASWYSDFKAIAKIALISKPQLREKLGWKE